MSPPPRKLVAGNWKMNGLDDALAEALELARELTARPPNCRVALCPPATLVHRLHEALRGGAIEVGAQTCHAETSGAYTGEVSAEMLRDAGAHLVILGHSERRTYAGETNEDVSRKVLAALRAGLEPVVCVGETLAQREAGEAFDVVGGQMDGSLPEALQGRRFALAYEPVWAIGTGLTPAIDDIEAMHAFIRSRLDERFSTSSAPILYGGSVNPKNAAAILGAREVGGALVGGASLRAEDFLPIVRAE